MLADLIELTLVTDGNESAVFSKSEDFISM